MCGHSSISFRGPWLQTHFDDRDVMQYGYPEELDSDAGCCALKRVHVKTTILSAALRGTGPDFVDITGGRR